jgi:hypothetical protein
VKALTSHLGPLGQPDDVQPDGCHAHIPQAPVVLLGRRLDYDLKGGCDHG